MGVKTRITVTARLSVKGQYICSHCGQDNEFLHVMEEKRTVVIGSWALKRVEAELRGKAEYALDERFRKLRDKKYSTPFAEERFNCYCKNCCHREIWAQNLNPLFNVVSGICKWLTILVGLFTLFLAKNSPEDAVGPIIMAVLLGAGWLGIFLWMKYQITLKTSQIAKLPPESVPSLTLPVTPESVAAQKTTASRVAASWVCQHCNTENSANYMQCKKCGKLKNM